MLSFYRGESAALAITADRDATLDESIGARVALTFIYTYRLR